MDIRLTPDQYRELLKSFLVGQYVREIAAERKGEDIDNLRPFESFLLSFASGFKAGELIRSTGDEVKPSKALEEEAFALMDEYDDDRFWLRLETELGERDFLETATAAERGASEATGAWPERVRQFYEKYHREFHAHGVGRLRLLGATRPDHVLKIPRKRSTENGET